MAKTNASAIIVVFFFVWRRRWQGAVPYGSPIRGRYGSITRLTIRGCTYLIGNLFAPGLTTVVVCQKTRSLTLPPAQPAPDRPPSSTPTMRLFAAGVLLLVCAATFGRAAEAVVSTCDEDALTDATVAATGACGVTALKHLRAGDAFSGEGSTQVRSFRFTSQPNPFCTSIARSLAISRFHAVLPIGVRVGHGDARADVGVVRRRDEARPPHPRKNPALAIRGVAGR